MYFWLKFFHIAAMSVWFTGLFFLPRLLAARHRAEADADRAHFVPIAGALFFHIMSPAALVTITLGMTLLTFGPSGGWLVMKLVLVTLAVAMHLHLGVVLYDLERGSDRHGSWFYRTMSWATLVLLAAIAGLTAAKPTTLPPLPPPPAALVYSAAGTWPSSSGPGGFSPYTPTPWRNVRVPPSQPTTSTAGAVTADISKAHGQMAATGSLQRSQTPAAANASSITAPMKWLHAET